MGSLGSSWGIKNVALVEPRVSDWQCKAVDAHEVAKIDPVTDAASMGTSITSGGL